MTCFFGTIQVFISLQYHFVNDSVAKDRILFRKTVKTVRSRTVKEVKTLGEMSLQHNTEEKEKNVACLGCTAVLWYDVVICMMACHWLLAGFRVINMGC